MPVIVCGNPECKCHTQQSKERKSRVEEIVGEFDDRFPCPHHAATCDGKCRKREKDFIRHVLTTFQEEIEEAQAEKFAAELTKQQDIWMEEGARAERERIAGLLDKLSLTMGDEWGESERYTAVQKIRALINNPSQK